MCDQTARAAETVSRRGARLRKTVHYCTATELADGTFARLITRGTCRAKLIQTAALALAATIASSTFANDGAAPVHGVPSRTLTEAVANFSEYNQRLEKALAQEPTPERLQEIHELTYTLQNALEKDQRGYGRSD
ncbi:hypothetical protein SSTU70S_00940 [Stutzerimonas stutzeri]